MLLELPRTSRLWHDEQMKEPEIKEINDEEYQPATKGYVSQEIAAMEKRFVAILDDRVDTITRHFDVAVENITDEMRRANREEIGLIKDQQVPDLQKRVEKLERVTGLAP